MFIATFLYPSLRFTGSREVFKGGADDVGSSSSLSLIESLSDDDDDDDDDDEDEDELGGDFGTRTGVLSIALESALISLMVPREGRGSTKGDASSITLVFEVFASIRDFLPS